jgi:hypothetical protein
VLGLERAGRWQAEIIDLRRAERGQFDAELVEVECRDLLVEVLGQYIDLVFVFAVVGPQLDLCEHLVGERCAHHKARVTGGAADIDQAPLGQHDQPLAVGKDDLVDLRLDLLPGIVAQCLDLDLAVEMADVADDRTVLHMLHVVDRDHVDVARGMLPVAVTKMSACEAASSIVVTW